MKNNGDLKDIDEAIELFNQRDARKNDPNKGNENKIINYNGSIFSFCHAKIPFIMLVVSEAFIPGTKK